MEEVMVIESFEHIMPATTDRAKVKAWVSSVAKPNMAKAGYTLVRWCWVDAADQAPILISLGEHESVERLKEVWQKEEMLAARDDFYRLFPDAKVRRRVMSVIEG
jgi:hypothetical protein